MICQPVILFIHSFAVHYESEHFGGISLKLAKSYAFGFSECFKKSAVRLASARSSAAGHKNVYACINYHLFKDDIKYTRIEGTRIFLVGFFCCPKFDKFFCHS